MPRERIQVGNPDDPAEINVGWQDGAPAVQLSTLAIPPGGEEAGMWVDLDRSDINRLIRNLRKARDAAYGKDE